MDIREAISLRHSVRKYRDQPIEGNTLELLEAYIADVSRESGLHLQLVRNEPRAFKSGIIKYGGFSNANNYIAMIGPKGDALRRKNRPVRADNRPEHLLGRLQGRLRSGRL